MKKRVRIVEPRETATEVEFRRQVSESLRILGRMLETGIPISAIGVQRVELEVTGADTDTDILLDTKRLGTSPPWGIVCVGVALASTGEPGALAGSVPWKYVTKNGRACARIRNLPGLALEQTYRVRLMIYGEA